MRHVLVIQMCRMGDLLQTTPLLRGLRRKRPDARVTMLVEDGFAGTPIPSHLYDRMERFPRRAIAAGLTANPLDWPAEVERVRDLVVRLREPPVDLLLNLTHSEVSAYIAGLCGAATVRGRIAGRDRRHLFLGEWMLYLWASQRARTLGCFNLVDLQTWSAGAAPDGRGLEIALTPEDRGRVQAWLSEGGATGRPIVAVQLGASLEAKRWPARRFIECVNVIPEGTADVVFVGTPGERALLDAERGRLTRSVRENWALTLGELAALLERSALLLTNDTGPMHVAAAVETPAVVVSTGPVFVHETGPYGAGHYALVPTIRCFPCAPGATCEHMTCRDDIDPRDVAALVRALLGAGDVPHPRSCRLLRSTFAADGRLTVETVWPATPDREDLLRDAVRAMWLATLPGPARPLAAGSALTAAQRAGFEAECEALAELAEAAAGIETLARQVEPAAPGARPLLASAIQERLNRVGAIGAASPAACQIAAYLTAALDFIPDTDYRRVAERYAHEAGTTAHRARLLAALLSGAAVPLPGAA